MVDKYEKLPSKITDTPYPDALAEYAANVTGDTDEVCREAILFTIENETAPPSRLNTGVRWSAILEHRILRVKEHLSVLEVNILLTKDNKEEQTLWKAKKKISEMVCEKLAGAKGAIDKALTFWKKYHDTEYISSH